MSAYICGTVYVSQIFLCMEEIFSVRYKKILWKSTMRIDDFWYEVPETILPVYPRNFFFEMLFRVYIP